MVITSWLAAACTSTGPGSARAIPGPLCGDSSLLRAGGVTWRCTFDDEFSSDRIDPARWTVPTTARTGFVTGPDGDRACYVNSPGTVAEHGGDLYLTVRQLPAPIDCAGRLTRYVAGEVSSAGRFSQTYGRFDVRARVPAAAGAGLQETFWLWPVDDARYGHEPASGEIDFAEFFGLRPALVVPHVHYVPAGQDPDTTTLSCALGNRTAFHDYTLVWTPVALTMGVDGRTCLVDHWRPRPPVSAPAPFDQPLFLALTQALGVNDNAFVPGRTRLPATTVIDYVRVWQRAG